MKKNLRLLTTLLLAAILILGSVGFASDQDPSPITSSIVQNPDFDFDFDYNSNWFWN